MRNKALLKWLNSPSVRPSAKRLSPSGIMPKRMTMSSNWRLLRRLPILATNMPSGQLVSILLDNAVKYASDGSPICLTLEKGKKGPVLRTVNCCEGLTQQQADKLFDRFYRVDQSRTTGGFGIGLSMARSIAEWHKGSIKATCCEENKIEFTVSLGKCV